MFIHVKVEPYKTTKETPTFENGETAMAIHDMPQIGMSQADLVTVKNGRTSCCGGVEFHEIEGHYDPNNFAKVSLYPGEQAKIAGGIPQDKFIQCMLRMTKSITFNSRNGLIPTEAVAANMVQLMEELGLKDEFFNPTRLY